MSGAGRLQRLEPGYERDDGADSHATGRALSQWAEFDLERQHRVELDGAKHRHRLPTVLFLGNHDGTLERTPRCRVLIGIGSAGRPRLAPGVVAGERDGLIRPAQVLGDRRDHAAHLVMHVETQGIGCYGPATVGGDGLHPHPRPAGENVMPVRQVPGGAVIHLLEQPINVGRGHIIGSPGNRGHQPTPVRAVEESLGGAVADNLAGLVVARPRHLPAHVAGLRQEIAIGVIGDMTAVISLAAARGHNQRQSQSVCR